MGAVALAQPVVASHVNGEAISLRTLRAPQDRHGAVRLAMTKNPRRLAGLLTCAALLGAAPQATAQNTTPKWPTRPVRLVHGFISGGSVDITARLLAVHMGDALGQQVIVDGRP